MIRIVISQGEWKKYLSQLNRLDKKVRAKLLLKACVEGTKIMLSQAKANAPVDTGALKKSLKIFKKYNVNLGYAFTYVKPNKSYAVIDKKGKLRRPVKYFALTQFGTKFTKDRSKLNWFGKVYDQTSDQALKKFTQVFTSGLV